MNIAIIDEINDDRSLLSGYIKDYCAENHIIVSIQGFDNGSIFIDNFLTHYYDIIFLDICINKMQGLSIAEKIRERDKECIIIFSTASTQKKHFLKGYKVSALDYMIKPYDYKIFKETMERCDAIAAEKSHFIKIKSGRHYVIIPIHDIIFTDYSNHYIYLHTKWGIFKSYMSFNDFFKLLKQYSQFISCYRNTIVNLNEVIFIEKCEFTMSNHERIAISSNQYSKIEKYYYDYVFSKKKISF